jgi:hypothetical protein
VRALAFTCEASKWCGACSEALRKRSSSLVCPGDWRLDCGRYMPVDPSSRRRCTCQRDNRSTHVRCACPRHPRWAGPCGGAPGTLPFTRLCSERHAQRTSAGCCARCGRPSSTRMRFRWTRTERAACGEAVIEARHRGTKLLWSLIERLAQWPMRVSHTNGRVRGGSRSIRYGPFVDWP